MLPIHALLPGNDGLPGSLGVVVNGGLSVGRRVVAHAKDLERSGPPARRTDPDGRWCGSGKHVRSHGGPFSWESGGVQHCHMLGGEIVPVRPLEKPSAA